MRGMLVAVGLGVALWVAAGIPIPASYGGQVTGDEPQYLMTAISLAEDGDLDISDERGSRRYAEFHAAPLPAQSRVLEDGRRISPHDPLLPLLLAGPVALGGWVGAKLALAGMAGGLAALLCWIGHRRLGLSRPTVLAAVLAFSLAPPLAVYGTQVYPEIPAALCVAAAVGALMGRPWRGAVVVVGTALVALAWLGVKYLPVAAALGAVASIRMWRAGYRRRLGWFLVAMGATGLAYVAGHLALYGGLTPYAVGDHFRGGEWTVMGRRVDLWARSTRLIGLLVDGRFGLAAWQPAFLLAVPAMAWLLRRRPVSWEVLTWPLAAGWLTASFVAVTMHGWWWPGRQVVVVAPLAVLAVAWWAEALPAVRRLLWWGVAAGVVSFAWLVGDGLAGRITWVVGFERTTLPLFHAMGAWLPDYGVWGPRTWALHAAWVAAMAGLALLGWRTGGPVAVRAWTPEALWRPVRSSERKGETV